MSPVNTARLAAIYKARAHKLAMGRFYFAR